MLLLKDKNFYPQLRIEFLIWAKFSKLRGKGNIETILKTNVIGVKHERVLVT